MEIYFDDLHKEMNYDFKEDFIFIEDIDKGAFGKVVHAKEKRTGQDIAVKIIDKLHADQKLIKKMKEEISILKKLNHENIVKFYGHIETSNQLLIKMEYLKYGTLNQWMKKHKKISEEDASLILQKVLSAIEYLHNNQICHRDIKPENIMLSKENDLSSIKIIDFGLSLQNFDALYHSDYCGTFIYMAPEAIKRKSYYLSVDIWSIGILMYMLLNKGEHPFYCKGDSKEEFIKKLKSIKELKCYNKISYMAMNLLKKLLEPDPIKRYKANEALKHPWITRNANDIIPKTFNEQLNNDNIIQNARELMMISIFLNYFKKNNIYKNKKKKKIDTKNKLDEILDSIKKKKSFGIYRISDDYIKKCEYISKIEKDRLKQLKEKCLDVSSTEEESDEKFNNNSNSNLNSNTNSNSNFSNSNIPIIKHCSTNKETSEFKIFGGLNSNNSKEKPILLIDSKNNLNKRKNYNNHLRLSEQKRISLKLKKESNLFLSNLVNDSNNYNSTFRATSKKKEYPNITRSTTKINVTNNINVFSYFNKNINNINPINLFLNNNNNICQIKTKNWNNKTNMNFDKNKNENNISKNISNSIKLPIIDGKNVHNRNVKNKNNKLLNLIK